jgi:type II secretory pathway component PulF
MNYDEFAFFNQQLAAMLRDGLPLEGALKQLCAGMRGPLRGEIQQLEGDLARGMPLNEALARRKLPDFYKRMVEIGARSNDLPGILTLVADHYQRSHALWARLKGLMTYPLIVILVSLVLTAGLSVVFRHFLTDITASMGPGQPSALALAPIWLWIAPAVLTLLALLWVGFLVIPAWRAWVRWNVPAFRDASLAQLASAMSLMLKNGTTLPDALALAEGLEAATPAGRAMLARWRSLVEDGQGKPVQWSGITKPFPPLFLWIVQKSGEDITAGFQRAADIFQARAAYRTEMLLYGALPVSILFLGVMVFSQIQPLVLALNSMMRWLTDLGGS